MKLKTLAQIVSFGTLGILGCSTNVENQVTTKQELRAPYLKPIGFVLYESSISQRCEECNTLAKSKVNYKLVLEEKGIWVTNIDVVPDSSHPGSTYGPEARAVDYIVHGGINPYLD
ncbi:MAG: hypothetical protein V1663_01750 [archaeon]